MGSPLFIIELAINKQALWMNFIPKFYIQNEPYLKEHLKLSDEYMLIQNEI